MTEEEPSLQVLVKELASIVKTLQGEVSELWKEKDGAVNVHCRQMNTPLQANERFREDEDVVEPMDDAESLLARDGEISKDDSGQSNAEGHTPKCKQCQLKEKPSWKQPLALSSITPRDANKISSPDAKWVKTPAQSWHLSS